MRATFLNSVLQQAKRLVASGLSVIPIKADGSKAPAVEWKLYQSRIARAEDLEEWFRNGSGNGLAVACEQVSGNLEVIDFDEPSIVKRFGDLVKEQGGEDLLAKLPLVRTPRGGYHLPYRCPDHVEGNQKLATKLGEDGRPTVLIETRGERGYVLAPGSPASCHPVGRPYTLLRGDLCKIPTISPGERTLLVDTARSLNEVIEPKKTIRGPKEHICGNRPGDDFNRRATWEEILSPHRRGFV